MATTLEVRRGKAYVYGLLGFICRSVDSVYPIAVPRGEEGHAQVLQDEEMPKRYAGGKIRQVPGTGPSRCSLCSLRYGFALLDV